MGLKLKMADCPHCGGSGKVPAEGQGVLLRAERLRLHVSSYKLAAALGISATHLLDMEKGRRGISLLRAKEYLEKLGELNNNRG